jgi:hypothetical protein|tara:strand:+ start:1086 stop:1568 length:483 start_codon:yes stop_codon:yes gene_type:complete
MQLIENFLPKDIFLNIQNKMLGPTMPWFHQPHSTIDSDRTDDFYFTHNFYADGTQRSELFQQIIHPILGHLEFNYLLRARGRLLTIQQTQVQHSFHVDDTIKHTVALYSVNTNNGHTLFENGEKSYSKENTLLIFDGSLKHATVPQTDTSVRVNINFNFT